MEALNKRSQRKLLFASGIGWLFDAVDVGILSFLIAALTVEWGLSPEQASWIGSVNSIGMAVGAIVFGFLADRIGRKYVFMITLLLFSIGSGLSVLSSGIGVFMIFRFVIGLGLGGELPVASTLVSESVSAEKRGRITVLLESFWAIGWIVSALIAYFIIPSLGWRVALLILTLPALYTIYLRKGIEEPHVFKKKGKRSINETFSLLFSRKYRKQTMMLSIVWFCVVFSYYGMFLWLPSVMVLKGFDIIHSFFYILIMSLAQLPGYFSAAWLIEKLGRKWVLTVYLMGTAISSLSFGTANHVSVLIITGMLLSFFNLGAWGAMYAYTPEQFSTEIRASGSGLTAAIGRVGGIFGPLLVGYLVAHHISIAVTFSVFCIAILIAIIAIVGLGQETKQQALIE